jgi:hypothetical protein
MPGSIHQNFLWLIGGDHRKVPFDDQLCHSSKTAATPIILDSVFLDFLTNAWVDWSDFLVAHWCNWRKVPFDDQRCHSSNMAATAAIFDLVSVDYLTNACIDWSDFIVAHWDSSIFTMFHFSLNLIFHTPTDNFPLGGACAMPCVALVM